MHTKYLTLTTGPIIDTLMAAQKTRELWAASYFFSYLMREIVHALNVQHSNKVEVVLPATSMLGQTTRHGAGLYPDRVYLKVCEGSEATALDAVWKVCETVVESVAGKIDADLKRLDGKFANRAGKEPISPNPFGLQDCINCLRQYIKLYMAEDEIASDENIVFRLSSHADLMDLQPRLLPVRQEVIPGNDPGQVIFPVDSDNRSPLERFFFLANWSFLFREGFHREGGEKRKRGFDSLIEVGSRELEHLDQATYQEIIKEEIGVGSFQHEAASLEPDEEAIIGKFRSRIKDQNGKTLLQDYHKYTAIVHADGDNIGKIIAAVGRDPEQIVGFSEALLAFAKEATEIVVNHGGAPIYMGGDDMLFLAPVCTRSHEDQNKRINIFDLIAALDARFRSLIYTQFEDVIQQYYDQEGTPSDQRLFPSMSYGISISFHKYPLYEAKGLSYGNLDHVKQEHKGKNAVRVTLIKHSGQNIPFLIPKEGEVWEAFLNFIRETNTNAAFLSSFTYKLATLKPVLKPISGSYERLEIFFQNNFNEVYASNKKFFEALGRFICALPQFEEKLTQELLYGTLRFVHFIHNSTLIHHEQMV